MRWFLSAFAAVVACAAPAARPTTSLRPATGARGAAPIDFSTARRLILEGMVKDSVPAVAIAIARGDSILWEEGFGYANRETGVKATVHTPFYLASVTKTLTATAAMVLRERGLLDLDRSANQYLGPSPLTSPAWDPGAVTPRRLANHTSGLGTFDLACSTVCRLPSPTEVIRDYGVVVWPPGERFDYSNIGYVALGEVVAHAARSELGAVLTDDVFRPLGMSDASLGIDPRRTSETAVQYSWTFGAIPRERTFASGASSVYASAHDLALFGMLHAKACRCTTRRVLSDASVDTMQQSVVAAGGSQYGLGWWVETDRYGYRSVLAQGGTDASSTWLRILPSERITVVVLTNKGVGFPSDVVDEMIAALLPRYAEGLSAKRARPAPSAASPSAAPPLRLDSSWVGSWRGIARTAAGETPLRIAVRESGDVHATIGSGPEQRSGRAKVSSIALQLSLPGDLETADSTEGRRLSFSLRVRDGALDGAVTASPPMASHLEGRVSYWVELRKER
ncbi:MAG TPA: serine hydrolase domain-containing protein [Gemmatimonadaceae bacterium]|nr:serine hydrolase domain-containing protein [Gemmatimonadaceae bacterium]